IISDDSDFDDPENLLIDSQGRLLVAEGDFPGSSGPGTIFIVNPADGSLSVFTTGGFFKDGPEDLVEDAFGNIFVLDDSADISADGRVIKVTPGGVQSLLTTFGSGFFNSGKVEGITIDNNGDLIVVGGTGSSAKVIKVDPDTGDKTVISDSSDGDKFLRPEGVAVDANGDIFVADGNPSDSNNVNTRGQIVKVNPGNGAQTVISSGIPWVDPSDIEILPPDVNGVQFLLVIDDAADDDGTAGMGAVIKVDPSDGSTEIISANGFFDSPEGLFIVSEVQNKCVRLPPPPPPPQCPECEKPDIFTVMYNGPDGNEVTISKKGDNPVPFGTFNDGDLIVVDAIVDLGRSEVNSETTYTFSIGGEISIHTSCSQFPPTPHIGQEFFANNVKLTVVSGTLNGVSSIPDAICPSNGFVDDDDD
ncbi:MAG: hypothetical protein IH792_04065, partial [Thaumarchaeota archaeon]|nr:hypothetical protein [Nitrososphaerota archaeon]